MSPAASNSIYSILCIPWASSLGTYLGLPTCLPQSKSRAFAKIKDKVQRKVARWKAKMLSQAGRTVLIQSIASALLSYFMLVFLLPKGLCHSIDSLLMKFWWGFYDYKSHHFYPKSWSSICQLKDVGGLGLRKSYDINRALVAKLGWKILNDPEALRVKALKAKYLGSLRFMNVQIPTDVTWVWKGILKSREVLEKGACWVIKNGGARNLWCDPWIPSLPSFRPSLKLNALIPRALNSVSELIDWSYGGWKVDLINECFDESSAHGIFLLSLYPRFRVMRMFFAGLLIQKGFFSLKSAYRCIQGSLNHQFGSPHVVDFDWAIIWKLKIQHRLKLLL